MTLVQDPHKSEQPGPAGRSAADPSGARTAVPAEGGSPDRERSFAQSRAPARPNGLVSPKRDFRAAVALIERASATIESLQARCRQLEGEAREIRQRAKLEIRAAESLAEDWQKLARASKTQLEECERRLGLTRHYAEAAEERAALAKQRLEAMQQLAAAEAEQFARIHDKIVAAFGIGSPAHGALDEALGRGAKL